MLKKILIIVTILVIGLIIYLMPRNIKLNANDKSDVVEIVVVYNYSEYDIESGDKIIDEKEKEQIYNIINNAKYNTLLFNELIQTSTDKMRIDILCKDGNIDVLEIFDDRYLRLNNKSFKVKFYEDNMFNILNKLVNN